MGGAERVAAAMHESFPTAPIYTTVALPNRLPKELRAQTFALPPCNICRESKQRFRQYFMLYPFAVEHFDLSEFDLIFSSSSGYAKGVRRRSNAIHVCYCHTPMRWAWRSEDYLAREHFGRVTRSLLPISLWGLRKWDLRAARQPNYYIANSRLVARASKKYTAARLSLFRRPSTSIAFRCLPHIED